MTSSLDFLGNRWVCLEYQTSRLPFLPLVDEGSDTIYGLPLCPTTVCHGPTGVLSSFIEDLRLTIGWEG